MFARALGLRFIAVVPSTTASAKLDAIRETGATVILARPGEDLVARATQVAIDADGHFMNQFVMASEVADWRGANNIADSLFRQLAEAGSPVPDWVVVGARTGGTSATIGRYVRFQPGLARTRLCVVDPEGPAFFKAYASCDWEAVGRSSPILEGTGRARVEPSFMPRLVDHMISIADVASVAAAHWLESRLGRRFGPSTGTNIIGALLLGQAMQRRGHGGTIATLACDVGERYDDTIYSDKWLTERGVDLGLWTCLLGKLGDFVFPGAFG